MGFVLVFLLGLVFTVSSQTTDLRPRDVNVTFANDFCLRASWTPPPGIYGMQSCAYTYTCFELVKYDTVKEDHPTTTCVHPTLIKEGTLRFSLQTECNGIQGEPVTVNVTTNPGLVHGFQCSVHSPTEASCSWTPSIQLPDLRLFYLIDVEAGCGPLALKECVIEPHPDGDVKKSVCHLSGEEDLVGNGGYFLFNGTQDGRTVRNTLEWRMNANVRPPALDLNLTRDGDKLIIQWTSPEVWKQWNYLLNYTVCNERKSLPLESVKRGQTRYSMTVNPGCRYTMKIKAYRDTGETPWSEERTYGENTSRHGPMIAAAIVSPLLVAIVLFLAFWAFRKYKEQIFPKVPEPKDFLKDLLENNNMSPAEKLYVPQEEVEDTKISIVLEAQVVGLEDAETPKHSFRCE